MDTFISVGARLVLLGLSAPACGGVIREAEEMDLEEDTYETQDASDAGDGDGNTGASGEEVDWNDSWNDEEFRTVTVNGMTVQLSEDMAEANSDREAHSLFATPTGTGSWFENPGNEARFAELDTPRGKSTHAYYYYAEEDDTNKVRSIFALLSLSPGAVDLGEYSGFGFWARFEDASSTIHVRADPADQLGTPAPGIALSISDEWDFYFVPLDSLKNDTDVFAELHFVLGDQSESGAFWLDDFGLVCSGQCP